MKSKSLGVRIGGFLLVLLIVWAAKRFGLMGEGETSAPPSRSPPAELRGGGGEGAGNRVDAPAGERDVLEAFAAKRSGVVVEVHGRVVKELADDNEGSRHQKFLMELAGGHTLLVSHNIDLAPRVPLDRGDEVEIRGQFEWNDRGGVLHWTHHDPGGRRPGGWIRHGGETFR